MALLVYLAAEPITRLFQIPEALWAFHLLALVPFLDGLVHLDMKRVQRHFDYAPATIVESGSHIVVMLAAWPIAAWRSDYSAILWLLIMRAVIQLVASHALAQRPYRWVWDRIYLRRLVRFGWPLLVNGLLIAALRQGDHLVTGSHFGMAVLAVYGSAVLITQLPTKMLLNIGRSLTLPLLAATREDDTLYHAHYEKVVGLLSLLAIGLGVPFIVLGGPLLGLVFGEDYGAAGAYIGWLACACMFRLMRTGPTQAAMARADTTNAMYANLVASVGLLGMLACAYLGLPIAAIAFFGFVGELLAFSTALAQLSIKQHVPVRLTAHSLLLPVLATLCAAVTVEYHLVTGWLSGLAATTVIVVACCALGAYSLGLQRVLLDFVRDRWGSAPALES